MPHEELEQLLKTMPRIAEVVNKFNSAEVQMIVFQELMTVLGHKGEKEREAKTDKKPDRKNKSEPDQGSIPKASKPKKRKNQSAPRFIKDLNLRPKGKKSLKDFVEEKKPTTNNDHYAVIVYYLAKIHGTENITVDHIYTCLATLKKRIPNALANTLSASASQKKFIDTSDKQNIQMTNHGENYIRLDLPAKNGNSK